MKNGGTDFTEKWNIETSIGPIDFHIAIDAPFFVCRDAQYCPRHNHASYEFYFTNKGKGTVFTDQCRYEILPDSYFIIRPGVYHELKASPSEPIDRYNFRFDFEIAGAAPEYSSDQEARDIVYALSNIHCFYSNNLYKIRPLLSEIQTELIREDVAFYPKVQFLFSILFISVVREIAASLKPRGVPGSRRIGPEDRISIIDRFFDMSYNHKATSRDLCALLHISRSQLNRILREKYGMTFKKKHMETQIERIKFMLLQTDLSIGEIAEKIGYTSEDNFIAFFKKATG